MAKEIKNLFATINLKWAAPSQPAIKALLETLNPAIRALTTIQSPMLASKKESVNDKKTGN
jgi:hypothetical protein